MRIKLFENFNKLLTKEDIELSLVDLKDLGYIFTIEEFESNCYEVTIRRVEGVYTQGDQVVTLYDYFDMTEVIESIYTLVSFLQEKFGDNFDYTLKYFDGNYEDDYEYINHIEDYIDNQELMNDLSEIGPTDKMILKIEIS